MRREATQFFRPKGIQLTNINLALHKKQLMRDVNFKNLSGNASITGLS